MCGLVFELEEYTFFTMGGASCHDIDGGILSADDPDFERKYWMQRRMKARFRVDHHDLWEEELPSVEEYITVRPNLERIGWQTDYVITHSLPRVLRLLSASGVTLGITSPAFWMR